MRLLLLSLPAGIEVLVGAGLIGPAYKVPWRPLISVTAAAMLVSSAGLLLADAFALLRVEEKAFGVLPANSPKAGVLLAAVFVSIGLFMAGSAGRIAALTLSVAAFLVLAAGGAFWRSDLWQPLTLSIVHVCMALCGAAVFPEFRFRFGFGAEGMELWRPLVLVWLAALICGLLARSTVSDTPGRVGWPLAGALVFISGLGVSLARCLDLLSVGAWVLVAAITLEQAVTLLKRRRRLSGWMARRMSLFQPVGIGAAWLVGAGGLQRAWGIATTIAFALCAVLLVLALGPAEARSALGNNRGGGGNR